MQAIIDKYEIQENNIFNFDETDFIISIALTIKVVTAFEKVYKPKTVQLGNCDWAIVIISISVQSWAILLFIILVGQYYFSA